VTPDLRIGMGFDVHAFGGDGPLVLGGVVIADAPGLVGHSDADVVTHAVADALLGAAGLPDLGIRFPASDERWRGASSIEMLRDVMEAVSTTGWRVTNVDVVVAAEQPALAPHVPEMITQLSEVLEAPAAVSPKRTEGVGAVGRGEGIAAWAVVLLVRDEQPQLGGGS
jgi:2-C-methyl-D-erythritol 2,4-cyclodiphosphate synthase